MNFRRLLDGDVTRLRTAKNFERLVHLDVCERDYLRPLPGSIGNQRAKFRRRHRLRLSAERDETRLHRRISDDGIDVPVKYIDNFGRRAPRRSNACPAASLVTG